MAQGATVNCLSYVGNKIVGATTFINIIKLQGGAAAAEESKSAKNVRVTLSGQEEQEEQEEGSQTFVSSSLVFATGEHENCVAPT